MTTRIHATEIIQPDGTRFVRIGGEWRLSYRRYGEWTFDGRHAYRDIMLDFERTRTIRKDYADAAAWMLRHIGGMEKS